MQVEATRFRSYRTNDEPVRALEIYVGNNFDAICDWLDEMGLRYDSSTVRKKVWILPEKS